MNQPTKKKKTTEKKNSVMTTNDTKIYSSLQNVNFFFKLDDKIDGDRIGEFIFLMTSICAVNEHKNLCWNLLT